MNPAQNPEGLARAVVELLAARGLTLGTCESLTGGGVCALLTRVPGASRVVRGALVTYASDLKTSLAGVDRARVERDGVVNEYTARAMAEGARGRLGVDLAVACTGVAGPAPQDGQPVGTVWVALAGDGQTRSKALQLTGDRAAIRAQTAIACLQLVLAGVDVSGVQGRALNGS